MKIKPEYKLRKVGGMNIVVSTAGVDFQGVITVNETAEFLWRMLEQGTQKQELVAALAKECDISESEISQDVEDFLAKLKKADIID